MDTHFATEGRDIVLTRRFAAPRVLVFQAWTDPRMLGQWFGPGEFRTTADMDVRAGGAFTIVMHGPDGTDYPIDGEFTEIVPGERLVMRMTADRHPASWHDTIRKAYIEAGGKAAHYSSGPLTTEVTFADDGDGTRMTVRQTFPDPFLLSAHATLGNPQGWSQSFDKLDTLLAA